MVVEWECVDLNMVTSGLRAGGHGGAVLARAPVNFRGSIHSLLFVGRSGRSERVGIGGARSGIGFGSSVGVSEWSDGGSVVWGE